MYSEPQVGETKSFLLTSLVEIIGKVKNVEDDRYELSDAFAVSVQQVPNPNDANSFQIRVSFTPMSIFAQQYSKTGGLDVPVYKSAILWVNDPPEELSAQYATQTSSILAPPSKIQTPR